MVKITDVEAREEPTPSELDPLIRHDVPVPTKKQARLAFLQFLAFCSALFMVGWTDGSIGPLIPTITKFYGVISLALPCSFLCSYFAGRVWHSILGIHCQLFGQ
jgi:hypothetical protein